MRPRLTYSLKKNPVAESPHEMTRKKIWSNWKSDGDDPSCASVWGELKKIPIDDMMTRNLSAARKKSGARKDDERNDVKKNRDEKNGGKTYGDVRIHAGGAHPFSFGSPPCTPSRGNHQWNI